MIPETPFAATAAELLNKASSRRHFLRNGVVAAFTTGVAAACKNQTAKTALLVRQSTPHQTTGTTGPHDPSIGSPPMTAADSMDAMHENGIKAFPAKTTGKGNQLLAARHEGGVKVFELTAKKIQWETQPGNFVEAWAYNDQVPGPQKKRHTTIPTSTRSSF